MEVNSTDSLRTASTSKHKVLTTSSQASQVMLSPLPESSLLEASSKAALEDSSGQIKTPALWAFFPTAEYDSFVTVGLTQSPAAGEGTINVIESAGNTWGDNFENGQDLLIDDAIGGGWFIFNGNTNGIAGDDEQVLLAQVTTNGELSGSLYRASIHQRRPPANDDRVLLDIEEACFAPGGPEVCEFPEEGYDCDGNCASDIDGDGICDPFEIGGCDDAQACNYDDNATDKRRIL